jgi:hypothetical protein
VRPPRAPSQVAAFAHQAAATSVSASSPGELISLRVDDDRAAAEEDERKGADRLRQQRPRERRQR